MAQKGYNIFNISQWITRESTSTLYYGQECHWLILSLRLYNEIVSSTEPFVGKGADIKRSLSYTELHKFKSNTEQISAISAEVRWVCGSSDSSEKISVTQFETRQFMGIKQILHISSAVRQRTTSKRQDSPNLSVQSCHTSSSANQKRTSHSSLHMQLNCMNLRRAYCI